MNSYVIGLTGGIGSGKTAATDWFVTQHIQVIDADVIAREIVAINSPVLASIQEAFGDWVLSTDGSLNRTAMRDYIFNHPDAREKLEAITHPAIRNNIKQQLQQCDTNYCILSAPLLLEGGDKGLKQFCQRILVIDVPEDIQKVRASARDKSSIQQIEKIMQAQISRENRLALADDVVDNSKNLDYLYSQLFKLHQTYLQLSHPS